MDALLTRFETRLNSFGVKIGPTAQAEVLGLSYRMFATYRAGAKMPLRIRRHIQVIGLLPDDRLLAYMRGLLPDLFDIEEDEL